MVNPNKELTKKEYYTVLWVLTSLALAFVAARLSIRLKVYGRLAIDDGLVILAMMCLLTAAITNSIMAPKMFIVQGVKIDHDPKPSDFSATSDSYAKAQWAVAYLFFTSIWAIKGSFLAFYETLTNRLPLYRRAWWAIIVFTILTYIGSLFAYAFLDGLRLKTNLKNEAIKYQFSADLTTDVLITIIPLTLALKSRVPIKQKLALAGLFSLSLVVTIFSIIRFVLCRGTAAPTWLQTWSAVEQSTSVIVTCLASFRILAISKRRASEGSSSRRYNVMNTFNAGKGRSSNKSGFSHLESQEGHAEANQAAKESMDIELIEKAHSRDTMFGQANVEGEPDGVSNQPKAFQGSHAI